MKFKLLFLSAVCCATAYSQKTIFYSVQPSWKTCISALLKSQNIKSDSVYYYKKKKHNKDSTLIMTQYFDSLGNLIERNEFAFDGEVFRITDYTYVDTVLTKEEEMAKTMFYSNGNILSKKLRTYDHDRSGDTITEKEYSFFGDSLKLKSVTQWDRVYNSSGHILKEFVTLPKAERYLYHAYDYNNGSLVEMKTYDMNQNWMYSYLYEYDYFANTKTVYLKNSEKTISHEFYYKDTKLVMEKDYEQGHGLVDHITQTYAYNANGLLESQTLKDLKGHSYYYKHFYSK